MRCGYFFSLIRFTSFINAVSITDKSSDLRLEIYAYRPSMLNAIEFGSLPTEIVASSSRSFTLYTATKSRALPFTHNFFSSCDNRIPWLTLCG